MLEYETAIGGDKQNSKLLVSPLNYKEIFIDEWKPETKQEKLLSELKSRLKEANPDVSASQMVCSIRDTLELSDDELRRIIPEGSTDDLITNSFVGVWYLASVYREGSFPQDMRKKHERHNSFNVTTPTSHLELMLERGVIPVLMQHYEIFKGEKPATAGHAPLLPAQ